MLEDKIWLVHYIIYRHFSSAVKLQGSRRGVLLVLRRDQRGPTKDLVTTEVRLTVRVMMSVPPPPRMIAEVWKQVDM